MLPAKAVCYYRYTDVFGFEPRPHKLHYIGSNWSMGNNELRMKHSDPHFIWQLYNNNNNNNKFFILTLCMLNYFRLLYCRLQNFEKNIYFPQMFTEIESE